MTAVQSALCPEREMGLDPETRSVTTTSNLSARRVGRRVGADVENGAEDREEERFEMVRLAAVRRWGRRGWVVVVFVATATER